MDHKHDEHCGCGCGQHNHEHHHHDHGEHCGCGCDTHHHHGHQHHEHGPDCGCATWTGSIDGLSNDEANILHMLGLYGYLPVTQFVLVSSKESSLQMVALAPVAIEDPADAMDVVKQRGALLSELEHKGLITLDYDIPISGYGYEGYRESAIFADLQQAVKDTLGKPGFLFDGANIEQGSMALTDAGAALLGVTVG